MPTKKIIIIGASSGIGRELAALYAGAGHTVAATARRTELLEQLAVDHPGRIITRAWDVRTMDNPSHLDALVDQLGGLDLLIICAGTGAISDTLDPVIEKTTIDTNVNAFAQIACWGFNRFVSQGKGQLVNISSVAAIRGNGQAPAYSASKAFQSLYFEGLRYKVRRMKLPIRITDVRPGFVNTRMAQGEGLFWVVPLQKAGRQIMTGIEAGRSLFYVSKRWRIIGAVMNLVPRRVFQYFG